MLEDEGHQAKDAPPIMVTASSFPASSSMEADQTRSAPTWTAPAPRQAVRTGPGKAGGGRCSSLAVVEDESHQLERKPVRSSQRARKSHRPRKHPGRPPMLQPVTGTS